MWVVAALTASAYAIGKLALGHPVAYMGPVFGLVGVVFGLGLRSRRAAALAGLAGFAVALLLLLDMPALSLDDIDASAIVRRGYKLDIGTMLAIGVASTVALIQLARRRPATGSNDQGIIKPWSRS